MAIQHRLNVTIPVSIAALLIAASPASLGMERAVPCKWVRTLAKTTTFAECNFAGDCPGSQEKYRFSGC